MASYRRTLVGMIALPMFMHASFAAAAETTASSGADYRVADCPSAADSVKLDVTNVPANRVLGDIIRLKQVHISHPERITGARFGAHFDCVSVYDALMMVADVSGSGDAVQRDGTGGYRIGPIKHHDEIEKLRKDVLGYIESRDKAQEKIALQKIIELAKPEGPDELEDFVSDEYADLAEIALQEQAYPRAEVLDRARLAQIVRLQGNDNDDYALALADLAFVRRKQGDPEAAALLARAVTMMEKRPGPTTLPASAKGLSNLAVMALEAKHADEAEALSTRAYKVLSMADQTDWNSLELYRAQLAISAEEEHFADTLVQQDSFAAATVHFERALVLSEKLNGEDFFLTNHDREMVALTSERSEVLDHVGDYYAHHLAAQGQSGNADNSPGSANMLFNLTVVRVKQEKYAEAIAAWQRVIEVRRHYRGPDSSQVIAALTDLALLYRLNRQVAEAEATEKQADAIKPDNANNALQLVGGLQTELKKYLAPFLNNHFDARIEALSQRVPVDDAALAQARQQLALCKAALLRLFSDARAR